MTSFTLALWPGTVSAQSTGGRLAWDGVIDAYYAYDFNEPPGGARAYATEPARHNEFAVNLAMVRGQYTSDRLRGSLGLGIGTYMEANYAAEPDHFRHLFKGWAGVNLGGSTWLDAGVLPSHIGFESAITPLNWTWSRSIMAEWSPYYLTGVRLGFQPTDELSATILAVNGWQNIRETNDGKAAGIQLQYRPSDRWLLNYSNYLGDEGPEAGPGEEDPGALIRFFHDFYAQYTVSERFSVAGVFDVGTLELSDDDNATWYGAALLARVQLAPTWALGLRAERYADPDQGNLVTGLADGFETNSASLNLDWLPAERVWLRIEGRIFDSDAPIWPSDDGLEDASAFVLSSIAITF
jgi:hypothetical protein